MICEVEWLIKQEGGYDEKLAFSYGI